MVVGATGIVNCGYGDNEVWLIFSDDGGYVDYANNYVIWSHCVIGCGAGIN